MGRTLPTCLGMIGPLTICSAGYPEGLHMPTYDLWAEAWLGLPASMWCLLSWVSLCVYIYIPRSSNVVPFWLLIIFGLGIIIYCPKGTTFEPLGIYTRRHICVRGPGNLATQQQLQEMLQVRTYEACNPAVIASHAQRVQVPNVQAFWS